MGNREKTSSMPQNLEWETPTRAPKRSLFSRASSGLNHAVAWARFSRGYGRHGQPTTGAAAGAGGVAADEELAVKAEEENGAAFDSRTDIPSQSSSSTSPAAPAAGAGTRPFLTNRLRSRFDAAVPPNRTYFGRTRRFFLCLLLAALLLLLILVLGLGLGLGLKHHGPSFLPLPGNGAAVYTGDLTYFNLALGACGWTNTDSELVCAVAHSVFDAAGNGGSDPNANPLCGKKIRIVRNEGSGNVSVDVKVVDRCVGCAPMDLDLSPAAFDRVAQESEGRVTGSWSWLD